MRGGDDPAGDAHVPAQCTCGAASRRSWSSLEVVVAGAEKLPIALCDAFEKKFGIRPVEGLRHDRALAAGVGERAAEPVEERRRSICKEGSVGRPVPGVSAKVVDPETFEDLPLGTPGMLLVKGPNVMKGYLGQPEETAKVMHDGWYVTGDIAMIDTDGFIHITGRLSRFSKIGGEMVPHIRIEEAIQKILGLEEGQLSVVVTSVPDETQRRAARRRPHAARDVAAGNLRASSARSACRTCGFPDADSFLEVEAIPVLGSGKTDLKAVSDLAKSHFHGG